jgi:Ca-activated chloride channel family protein
VAFASQVRTFAPGLVSAGEAEEAIAWIEALEALGGTNIYVAFSEALAQVDRGNRSTIVFLTDGLPTEGVVDEDVLLNTLRNEAPEDVRIFPLGVGYDVNVLLLDQLADDHRGRPTYIEPDERIDEKVSTFFARMQSPLLTDISLDFGGVQVFDIYPTELPDLYAGTQLIVTGRYAGSGPQTLTLSGRVNERTATFTYDVTLSAHDGKDFIPRLWAARKIGHLLTQIRIHGERAEWVQAVVDLSLRYGIITPYTSFLIEEPEAALTQEGRTQASETLQEQLAAAPTAVSGEKAVDDANLRLGLGNAEAPSAGGAYAVDPDGGEVNHGARSIRYAGDRTFLCTNDGCTDTRFVPDTMMPRLVPFLSGAYYDLLAAEPELALVLALSAETIVVAKDGSAYRFTVTETEDLPRPPLAPTEPGPESTSTPPAPAESTPTGSTTPEAPAIPARTPSGGPPLPCPAPLLLLAPILAVVVKRRLKLV